jgi:ribonuclease P protein component
MMKQNQRKPKKYRPLNENHLFGKIYQKGKKYVGTYIVVYVLPDYSAERLKKMNPDKIKVNRVGITVSKKIGCAVKRNRARRIIREAYRLTDAAKDIKRGFLVVIVSREAAVGVKTADITAELNKALGYLRMFFANQ